MKILQTGDLHLGKFLYEFSLLKDQKHMLNHLTKELSDNSYDVLIITGDIYDRAVPPSEAISLFDDFLTDLHNKLPDLKILMISGNHDSSSRLSFGTRLFSKSNIYLETETNPEKLLEKNPLVLKDKNNLPVAFFLVPFLEGNSLKEVLKETGDKVLNEYKDMPSFLVSHSLIIGSETSSSERVFIGTAENMDKSLLSPFTYAALGHIHKPQKVADNAYYAGSPIAYSFDEIKYPKSFLSIEIAKASDNKIQTSINKIPVNPLRKMVILKDSFNNFLTKEEYKANKDDFIEFICTDKTLENQAAVRLKKRFPYFMDLRLEESVGFKENEKSASYEIKRKIAEQEDSVPLKDVFLAFVKDVCGETEDYEEEAILLEKIAKEIEKENE